MPYLVRSYLTEARAEGKHVDATSFTDFLKRARSKSKDRRSLGDKAIEVLIEGATPEADEDTRVIQRAAMKYLFSPTQEGSDRHFEEMQNGIKNLFE